MVTKADAPYYYLSINGEFYDLVFLESVRRELINKIPLWQSGIESPSQADKFAYHVLKQIRMKNFNED